jgi:hypothetical protein
VEGNRHLTLDAIVIDALDQPVNEPGLLGRRQRLPHRRKVAHRIWVPPFASLGGDGPLFTPSVDSMDVTLVAN